MSWAYCFVNTGRDKLESSQYARIHPAPLQEILTDRMYLALGGNNDTCHWRVDQDSRSGWAIVGLGISGGDVKDILEENDWAGILARKDVSLTDLDGHFIVVRWTPHRVSFFTDQLGLRTLFFSSNSDGVCASTRLDWVARTMNVGNVDFSALGSKWLLYNQLEYESGVKNIGRLGTLGHLAVDQRGIVKQEHIPWSPTFKDADSSTMVESLSSLVKGLVASGWPISLGLSGGLDSRVLLAAFVATGKPQVQVHTFGSASDPDVQVSERIAHSLKLRRQYLHDRLPAVDETVESCKRFVAQTCLVEPTTSWCKLRYYPALRPQVRLMIDGGFGEVARRQYMNRVVILGKRALLARDCGKLFSLMRVDRGGIFSKDVLHAMEVGAKAELERVIENLPRVEDTGVENWVDLFAVRTRLPNYGAPEQARIDEQIANIMPLVQPSFLRSAFACKVQIRRSGKLYKELIRKYSPQLTQFPLVKSGVTYGFMLPTLAAWLTTKAKARIAPPYIDDSEDALLGQLEEYIRDIAYSSDVAQYEAYDHSTIKGAVEGYFRRRDGSLRSTVSWWLTFELWRRSLRGS